MSPRPVAALAVLLLAACDATPTGTLLVASGFTDEVYVLAAADGRIVDTIALDPRRGERDEPHAVAAAPDGRHWYATVSHGEPTLWKFESEGHRLVGRLDLPLRAAGRVHVDPGGRLAAVAEYWRGGPAADGRVALVRTEDLSVVAVRELCAAPHDAVFDPSGTRLAVTCSGGDEVLVVDAATLEPLARHAVEGALPPRPMNAAWSDDGRRLFATLMGGNAVAEWARPLDPTVSPTLHDVAADPAQIATVAGGRTLAVAQRGSRSALLLDPDGTTGLSVSIPGEHPHGVATDDRGRVVYVTYEGAVETTGGVVAIDAATGELRWHTPLGSYTLGVAWLAAEPPATDGADEVSPGS